MEKAQTTWGVDTPSDTRILEHGLKNGTFNFQTLVKRGCRMAVLGLSGRLTPAERLARARVMWVDWISSGIICSQEVTPLALPRMPEGPDGEGRDLQAPTQ